MPKLVISEVPSGSVAAIPASFVRLVTTYLMKYIEDWSVSMAHLIHKPIEATLLIALDNDSQPELIV